MPAAVGGANHFICLNGYGEVYSFGRNESGQCGHTRNSKQITIPFPTQIPLHVPIQSVACGQDFSVCVDVDGVAWGFGINKYGEIGMTNVQRVIEIPTKIEKLPPVQKVVCGDLHSNFLANDGTIWSMGANYWGQLALGHTNPTSVPTQSPYLTDIIDVISGHYVVFFTDKQNDLYLAGTSSPTSKLKPTLAAINPVPVKLELEKKIIQIVCCVNDYYLLDIDGEITNIYGDSYDIPKIVKMYSSKGAVFFVTQDNRFLMCGTVSDTKLKYSSPEHVFDDLNIDFLSTGGETIIIKDTFGKIWTWGSKIGKIGGNSLLPELIDEEFFCILASPTTQKSARK